MTIKLRFDEHPEFPGTRVWTEDRALASVGGMLSFDLHSAREWAQKLKDVVSGKIPPFQGYGNGYFTAAFPEETEVGLGFDEDPETVSVSTADLIVAVEEWAAHLERKQQIIGSG